MPFAHDTEASLLAAVALVNSAVEPDTLATVEQLDAFYRDHAYTGARTRDREELDQVRALRGPLRELLTSSRDDAVPLVNRMLAQARAVPQLVRHDGGTGTCTPPGRRRRSPPASRSRRRWRWST
jgi:hypothetical protein